jgi:hypothetical protein
VTASALKVAAERRLYQVTTAHKPSASRAMCVSSTAARSYFQNEAYFDVVKGSTLLSTVLFPAASHPGEFIEASYSCLQAELTDEPTTEAAAAPAATVAPVAPATPASAAAARAPAAPAARRPRKRKGGPRDGDPSPKRQRVQSNN